MLCVYVCTCMCVYGLWVETCVCSSVCLSLTCTLDSLLSDAPQEVVALGTGCGFSSRPRLKLVHVRLCICAWHMTPRKNKHTKSLLLQQHMLLTHGKWWQRLTKQLHTVNPVWQPYRKLRLSRQTRHQSLEFYIYLYWICSLARAKGYSKHFQHSTSLIPYRTQYKYNLHHDT